MNNRSSWPESLLSGHRKMAIEKLLQGSKFTTQLQNLFNTKAHLIKNEFDRDHDLVIEDLVSKISDSFTDTISILNSSIEAGDMSVDPTASSLCGGDGQKSEDSGDSGRSTISTLKDRRGCYKRRKSANSWTRLTTTFIDDGHAWRKYGQKVILNAKHPRSYFRCTHKLDQGCQATKHVQKTEDDNKTMYRTTYIGQHTCKTLLQTPKIIFDPTTRNSSNSSMFFLDFGSGLTEKYNENLNSFIQSPSCSSVKKESKDIMPNGDHTDKKLFMSNYLLSPDLKTLETSGHVSSTFGSSDYGDAISELRSYGENVDLDFMAGLSDFDDAGFGLVY